MIVYWYLVQELLEKGEKNANVTLGVLATIPVLLFTILFSLCFGKKKSVPSVSRLPPFTLAEDVALGPLAGMWCGMQRE